MPWTISSSRDEPVVVLFVAPDDAVAVVAVAEAVLNVAPVVSEKSQHKSGRQESLSELLPLADG